MSLAVFRSPLRLSAAALLGCLALTACSEKATAPAAEKGRGNRGGGGPAPVIAGQAQRRVVPLVIDAIGTVEPIRSAAVRAQITGTLFKIDIREGQDVAAGDLLFEIDPRPFENALKSAIADQQRIAVQLRSARTQLERYRGLNVGTMVSQDQVQQLEDSMHALEAQALASESAVATARLQLSYCSIRAPIAGRTGNLNVHEGDLIRANDVGTLVTVNQLSPIYVTFGVAQQQLAALTRYRAEGTLRVEAALGAGEERFARGELTFMDNTVDSTTGTIKLKATFPNQDLRLWPGQFSTVMLTLSSPEVLTVPASAIQTDQTGQHVFVVAANGNAEFRPVVVERTWEDVAVVTRGVAAGETVVTDGQLRVVAGRPVQVKPAEILTNPDGQTGVAEEGATRGRGKSRKQGT